MNIKNIPNMSPRISEYLLRACFPVLPMPLKLYDAISSSVIKTESMFPTMSSTELPPAILSNSLCKQESIIFIHIEIKYAKNFASCMTLSYSPVSASPLVPLESPLPILQDQTNLWLE